VRGEAGGSDSPRVTLTDQKPEDCCETVSILFVPAYDGARER
jgi:hypothetical protein